jgi:hypothetical protein
MLMKPSAFHWGCLSPPFRVFAEPTDCHQIAASARRFRASDRLSPPPLIRADCIFAFSPRLHYCFQVFHTALLIDELAYAFHCRLAFDTPSIFSYASRLRHIFFISC